VEHPHPFTDGLMFGRDPGGVLHRHVVPCEGDHLGGVGEVHRVEGSLLEHGWYGCVLLCLSGWCAVHGEAFDGRLSARRGGTPSRKMSHVGWLGYPAARVDGGGSAAPYWGWCRWRLRISGFVP